MIQGYAVSTPIDVRWRDVDALGHVNNAVYFTYFEIARTRYLDEAFGARRLEEVSILLASARCDFVSEVGHGEVLEVGIRVSTVGNTSFEFEYEIHSTKDGRVVARGTTAQVLYDHVRGRKLPVTEEWLDRVEAVEGRRPARRAGSATRV